MHSASWWMRAALALSLILRRASCAAAAAPEALSVTPSTKWYGDDGTWSAVSIRVGTPPQWVDVFPSTVSSETWVVGSSGCDNNSVCSSERGGLFNLGESTSWSNEGFFYLEGKSDGYGQYGLDDLTFGTTGVTIQNAIIASINETEYWLGEFGLGIVPGNFTDVTSLSAISNLVEKGGVIPSHSYGFTAGAKYQQKGETVSLTLGGYDANRFVPHNTTFNLNPSQNPQAYISSVTVVSSSSSSNNWTTPVQLVSSVDQVSAVIDSTTPYLWLPQSACERFAVSLGLTYNESLNIYTFDGNPAQHEILQNAELSFTFALSDIQSSGDDVNITLPYTAFDLQLTYPAIPNTTYGAANSSAYYFPLKQAANEAQYVIGRAFLQEAYIVTDYERNTFSVHQAVHIADPIGNTSIVSITRPSDSTLSPPPTTPGKKGLPTGAIVGIVVAAAVVVALLCFVIFALCRRRKPQGSDASSSEKLSSPRPFFGRFRRHRAPPRHETTGSVSYPTEVGADATHERFELPAPLGPAELDSESGTFYGTTERGSSTQNSVNISAYERARRKLQRQQNPISPLSATTDESYPIEKSDHDVSTVPHYRPENEIPDIETPLVSPIGVGSSGGSLGIAETPSPVSPSFGPRAEMAPISPPPTYRRVNPQNVVYVGRIPDNVQLPRNIPSIVGPDGRTIRPEQTLETEEGTFASGAGSAGESSLGSMYTENEEQNTHHAQEEIDLYGSGSERGASAIDVSDVGAGQARAVRVEDESKFLREDIQSMRADIQTREILDSVAVANRRRLDGEDLVHVPQPAEHRFSWEEERTEGTD